MQTQKIHQAKVHTAAVLEHAAILQSSVRSRVLLSFYYVVLGGCYAIYPRWLLWCCWMVVMTFQTVGRWC